MEKRVFLGEAHRTYATIKHVGSVLTPSSHTVGHVPNRVL